MISTAPCPKLASDCFLLEDVIEAHKTFRRVQRKDARTYRVSLTSLLRLRSSSRTKCNVLLLDIRRYYVAHHFRQLILVQR